VRLDNCSTNESGKIPAPCLRRGRHAGMTTRGRRSCRDARTCVFLRFATPYHQAHTRAGAAHVSAGLPALPKVDHYLTTCAVSRSNADPFALSRCRLTPYRRVPRWLHTSIRAEPVLSGVEGRYSARTGRDARLKESGKIPAFAGMTTSGCGDVATSEDGHSLRLFILILFILYIDVNSLLLVCVPHSPKSLPKVDRYLTTCGYRFYFRTFRPTQTLWAYLILLSTFPLTALLVYVVSMVWPLSA